MGFITLSRQFDGSGYGHDDFDLMRAIAHHAGMLLALAKMAEEQSAAGELEALHRFSAFCLHDLKNLAAKLSLVVQNAELHGEEPAFQQSVMRAVAGTGQKMMALITKLSLRSVRPGLRPVGRCDLLLGEKLPEPFDPTTVERVRRGLRCGQWRRATSHLGSRFRPIADRLRRRR